MAQYFSISLFNIPHYAFTVSSNIFAFIKWATFLRSKAAKDLSNLKTRLVKSGVWQQLLHSLGSGIFLSCENLCAVWIACSGALMVSHTACSEFELEQIQGKKVILHLLPFVHLGRTWKTDTGYCFSRVLKTSVWWNTNMIVPRKLYTIVYDFTLKSAMEYWTEWLKCILQILKVQSISM